MYFATLTNASSVGTGSQRLAARVPDLNNEFIETSLQISKPGVAPTALFVDGPARRHKGAMTSECVHNEDNLQRAQASQTQKQPEKYYVHDYDVLITNRLDGYMHSYKILKTQLQLSKMNELLRGSSSESQLLLLKDIYPILKGYLSDIRVIRKDYRPSPRLRLSGARLSFLTSSVVWLVQNAVGAHRQFRFPKWLWDGRVEFKADDQREYPELSLRFSSSVEWWDDEIYRAVSDDDLEALLSLYSVKGISILQRNGWSLLHVSSILPRKRSS